MRKKKHINFSFFLFIFIIAYIIYGFITPLKATYYEYSNSKIPIDFDGFKIIHISDLHCKSFGKEQEDLISIVKQEKPDLIVLSGDMVDKDHDDITPTIQFLEGVHDLAPIYFVTGNHELDPNANKNYSLLKKFLFKYNIPNLDSETITISKGNSSIFLRGESYNSYRIAEILPKANTDYFNMLLYHASDTFDAISNYGYDLVFSGHAHGGIIRLPFIGSIFGNKGMFPKYSKGLYQTESSALVSNAGLGDAYFPRFYNPPEVVVLTLHLEK